MLTKILAIYEDEQDNCLEIKPKNEKEAQKLADIIYQLVGFKRENNDTDTTIDDVLFVFGQEKRHYRYYSGSGSTLAGYCVDSLVELCFECKKPEVAINSLMSIAKDVVKERIAAKEAEETKEAPRK